MNNPLETAQKLWLLTPIKPWKPWYDKTFGMVIRAPSEGAARILAGGEAGDEGANAWLDQSLTICQELSIEGESEVILRDHAAA